MTLLGLNKMEQKTKTTLIILTRYALMFIIGFLFGVKYTLWLVSFWCY